MSRLPDCDRVMTVDTHYHNKVLTVPSLSAPHTRCDNTMEKCEKHSNMQWAGTDGWMV